MSNFYNVTTASNFINSLRTKENAVLQTVTGAVQMPMISFPSQDTWNSMDDDARFLWLINEERKARNLKPYSGVWPALDSVSQYYADYIRVNNVFTHNADGKSSTQRYTSVPGYNTCKDNSPYSENLYFTGSSVSYKTWYIIDAIAQFLYQDDCCAWGHRRVLLYKSPIDNSGNAGEEGLIGVGVSKGSYTNGGNTYAYSILLTFNFFDPCAFWKYPTITGINPATISGTSQLSILGSNLMNMNKILLPDGQQFTFTGTNTMLQVTIPSLSVSGFITVSGLNGYKSMGNIWITSSTNSSPNTTTTSPETTIPGAVVTIPGPVVTTPSPIVTIPSPIVTTTSPMITVTSTLSGSNSTLIGTNTSTIVGLINQNENQVTSIEPYVYPNPSSDILYFSKPCTVVLFNALGQEIFISDVEIDTLELKKYTSGIYLLILNKKVKIRVLKL
jgi:hypothetical protein